MPTPQAISREKIADGIYFSSVRDEKFTSNRLSVSFLTPLNADTVTENAIVPSILRLGCKSCPDFTVLNQRLGRLYGAQLYGDATKFGDRQILNVSIKGLDDRAALNGEDMVQELCALLCDIVLDPLTQGDGFCAENTALERQNLIDAIESEINDKRSYAQTRCVLLMFGGGPRGLRPFGTVERAKKITPQSALAAYRQLLGGAQIECMFVGSGQSGAAKDMMLCRFGAIERKFLQPQGQPSTPAPGAVKEKTEELDVSQSKLVLGFSSSPKNEEEMYALRMMGAMFGGTPFSKLFLNVREKLSLCYYCSARYERGNRIMLVSSGVEKEKKQAACDEILHQLEELRAGNFTAEELTNTKLALDTGFASVGDSLAALEGWYLSQIASGGENSPEYEREQMNAVSREAVIAAAKGISLDTVYFLTSPDHAAGGEGQS